MQLCELVPGDRFSQRHSMAMAVTLSVLLAWTGRMGAGTVAVPNGSFQSPDVPPEVPYASIDLDEWQKSPQPFWYDPSQNHDALWVQLTGQFFNVPFPGQFIDNCDGDQAAFIFAVPEVGLFQDYDSISGTNTAPSHAFDAKFQIGNAYDLTVGVIGGGGGMKEGVTLELSLYYRDPSSSNKVTVASTNITNTPSLFSTNTHFVDFHVEVPTVKETDPWVGQHIGIQLLSTTSFELAGGYWDVDNVRLIEKVPARLTFNVSGVANGQISLTVLSEPGIPFELQATTNLAGSSSDWIGIGTFDNVTGGTVVTENATNFQHRYYRARGL